MNAPKFLIVPPWVVLAYRKARAATDAEMDFDIRYGLCDMTTGARNRKRKRFIRRYVARRLAEQK